MPNRAALEHNPASPPEGSGEAARAATLFVFGGSQTLGLDTVELIIAFEQEFGLSIPDADAERLTTPRRVTEYVWGKITHERVTRGRVAERVRAVVRRQTSLQDFGDDAHFVHDLGLD